MELQTVNVQIKCEPIDPESEHITCPSSETVQIKVERLEPDYDQIKQEFTPEFVHIKQEPIELNCVQENSVIIEIEGLKKEPGITEQIDGELFDPKKFHLKHDRRNIEFALPQKPSVFQNDEGDKTASTSGYWQHLTNGYIHPSSLTPQIHNQNNEHIIIKRPRKNAKKEQIFFCDICGRKFTHKSHIISHLRAHAGVKRYTCDICNNKFANRFGMIRHQLIHTGQKPYSCEVCNKVFTRKSSLVSHLPSHSEEKKFRCDICSKLFACYPQLKRHKREHLGEKPFVCEVCQRRFHFKSDLSRHQPVHLENKPFECHICQNQFAQKSHLERHLRAHAGFKPFSCYVCKRGYSRKCDLQRHLRTHSSEPSFSCDVCSEMFTPKAHLFSVTQMDSESDEKQFLCEICKKTFNFKCNFVRHKCLYTCDKCLIRTLGITFDTNDQISDQDS